ncbi:hypothetical protein [Chryseobacterium sp. 22543]|uniref:hypothetical protein n=1 Tax=Chryseobacterium sp. 22543 TaxID=3453940 RepID=UPI003F87744A
MKKTSTHFEPQLWKGGKKRSGLQLMENFFRFNDLAVSKEKLNSIMSYAVKRNSWINEDPSVVFQFHQAVRSFVRAGYLIHLEGKKWVADTAVENPSPLFLGLLSEKEYHNPLLVFKKAFKEYSVKEFDYFMSGIVYFSMGAYDKLPETNLVNPYIHLLKMLDAAHLILERRGR